jgi:hypothetical protein
MICERKGREPAKEKGSSKVEVPPQTRQRKRRNTGAAAIVVHGGKNRYQHFHDRHSKESSRLFFSRAKWIRPMTTSKG